MPGFFKKPGNCNTQLGRYHNQEMVDAEIRMTHTEANIPASIPNKTLQMLRFLLRSAICAMVLSAATPARGQAPVLLKDNPLKGVIDFHVHSGPDNFTRSVTDVEIARIAKARGMRALVLKNHLTITADRAWLAERLTGMRCCGGIVLNRAGEWQCGEAVGA